MKNFFIVALFLFSLSALAQISIISDLDDTIKITQAGGNATDIIGDDVYTGMPEFLKEAKAYSGDLYVLSASPSFMDSIIRSTLRKNGVDYKRLILRRNLFEDKFSYKVREIKKIMNESKDDFILIGDDLGDDPEVYAEIERLYPGRILGRYIHKVNNRNIPSSTIYWTSFELFLYEFELGRMDASAVEKGIDALMAETDLEFIFPKKAHCPTDGTVWEWQTRTIFQQEATRFIKRFVSYCKARQSVIIND